MTDRPAPTTFQPNVKWVKRNGKWIKKTGNDFLMMVVFFFGVALLLAMLT